MANIAVWFEIPVSDLNRAKKFYSDILNVEFEDKEKGPMTMAMFPFNAETPGASGALVKGPNQKPCMDGSTVYLDGGEDLTTALSKVEGAGGKILSEKMSIGEFGFIASFQDTEGNAVSLHSMK